MNRAMREPSLGTIGLGGVLDIFKLGRLPATAEELADEVFGPAGERGSLVISGSSGIVGAGKAVQLSSRLHRLGVRVVGLDFHGAPDGIRAQYPALVTAFGQQEADRIIGNILRLGYDGSHLSPELAGLRPRLLLEAIPEKLELKKAHYEIFRKEFPDLEVRSVTSGFPGSELGVGIAHPSFPHQINKVWEVVEPKPSAITRLLWALGMIPVPVSDHWSFVLDVLFCGLTHASVRYHRTSNMPYWKIDKWVRRLLGPNPFRAHEAIGARGSNFLTWSCLHHLGLKYGPLFEPTPEFVEHKDAGSDWYPPGHFRPLVDWKLSPAEESDLGDQILGPLFQMTSLVLHENRARLDHVNAIGELCAQFRRGVLAVARGAGPAEVLKRVAAYHKIHPEAARGAWHPEVFEAMDSPEWQQLYVNAEHDGRVGVITLGRESYNQDVDRELNRAIDWLQQEGIERVILTHDFHLATQLVGADTADFHPALRSEDDGIRISTDWSETARRLHNDFKVSVGFAGGKRCLGGCLELLLHCRYIVAREDAELGMPEVTLPVVPGMEGCHWPFRKAASAHWPELLGMLLGGRAVKARQARGWLVDHAAPLDAALATAWLVASGGDHGLPERKLVEKALQGLPAGVPGLPEAGSPGVEAAREAILATVRAACGSDLPGALAIQARHSAAFMLSDACFHGRVGTDYQKTQLI